jgi:hypothetical protein
MTKTIKIKSKRKFLYDTLEDILFDRYKYLPASKAVKVITAAVLEFNAEKSDILIVATKATDDEKAKVKLTGNKRSIDNFLNRLFVETELLEHFDIKCCGGIINGSF